MSAFVIALKDVEDFAKRFRFAIDASWLRSALEETTLHAPEAPADGALDVEVQKTGKDILVRSHIVTTVNAECARCLEPVPLHVDVHVTSLLLPESERPRDEQAIDVEDDELDREYYSGEKIVLDDIVREHILLEEPLQPLCREDCPGIAIPERVRPPADFGKPEEGTDPRLAPLMKWKRKLAQNEE